MFYLRVTRPYKISGSFVFTHNQYIYIIPLIYCHIANMKFLISNHNVLSSGSSRGRGRLKAPPQAMEGCLGPHVSVANITVKEHICRPTSELVLM